MKVVERIKTLLFALLFISSVILAGIYITGMADHTGEVGEDIPADVLSALRGRDGAASAHLYPEQLLPEFLGIKQSGQTAVGLFSGTAMMEDLNDVLSPWVAAILGENMRKQTVTDGDASWRAALSRDSYFYLCWSFPVPASLLRGHSLPDAEDAMLKTAEGDLRIREIFFFPYAKADGISAVSRDGEGNVTIWYDGDRSEMKTLPGMDAFSIYLARGVLADYRFAGESDGVCPSALLTLPIPASPVSMDDLVREYPFAASAGPERVPVSLLNQLDYNLNKVSGYFEAEHDTAVFVETHGTLRATAERVTYEAAAQGGISIADFLRKSQTGLNLRDDVMACERLAEELCLLDGEIIGGAADLQMTALYTEGEILVVEYAYFYDNVRIADDAPALRIEVEAHKIISLSLAVSHYRVGETSSRAAGQQWMLELVSYLREQGKSGTYQIALVYRPAVSDEARMQLDWNLYTLG